MKLYKFCGVALGTALLLFLHFYKLGTIPGLHYDEAWALNFSWRIATEKGFWPVTAMSPYTAPWTHYWAALWLKVLGPSVAVFRASQVSLALVGMGLLCLALPKHVRAAFPWAVLLLPGLLLNHRFAIELNSFHVLCFGALCWSLRRENFALACAAALLGTTAHILFYSVALALAATALLEGIRISTGARRGACVYLILMAAFFLQVTREIPEKGKGAALVLSALALLGIFLAKLENLPLWRAPLWPNLMLVGVAVFLLNAVFFAQGYWGAGVITGLGMKEVPFEPLLFFVGFPALCVGLFRGFQACPRKTKTAFLALTLLLGVLMLKPAPRYFELSFLGLAALLAWDLQEWIYLMEWPISRRLQWLVAFSGLLAVNPGFALSHAFFFSPVDEPLHFLFFKDSSRDFLDKQSLARHLGGSGCALSDIHSGDPRLMEELKALSLGDWPVDRSRLCAYNVVSRRSEGFAIGEPFGEFLLRRKP